MSSFVEHSLKHYIDELSARAIVPGGGSAAALTAALGAGLNMMAINFTIDRERPEETPQEILWTKDRQMESLDRITALVDKDCEVFKELMKALQSGEDTQIRYIEAAKVPMEVCRECHVSLAVTGQLLDKSNPKLATDIGCAAYTLKAAFASAKLNVEVNLRYIEDLSFIEKFEKEMAAWEKDIAGIVDDVEVMLKGLGTKKDQDG